jgi:hypothetical protein
MGFWFFEHEHGGAVWTIFVSEQLINERVKQEDY